jgi:prepilin-type N-terminal cleavage/methylation domain-containing protein
MCANSSERRRFAAARRRACGFTLPELIVVILLTSVLAAVALPKLNGATSFRDDAWRDQVVAALHHAHKSAISHRRLVCANVTTSAVTLSIASANPATACNTALPGVDGNASAAVNGGSAATTQAPAGTLYFQPSGRVSTNGAGTAVTTTTIRITGQTNIVLVGESGHVE